MSKINFFHFYLQKLGGRLSYQQDTHAMSSRMLSPPSYHEKKNLRATNSTPAISSRKQRHPQPAMISDGRSLGNILEYNPKMVLCVCSFSLQQSSKSAKQNSLIYMVDDTCTGLSILKCLQVLCDTLCQNFENEFL